MNEVKLKPCPFCAGYPRQMLAKVQYCSLHGDPYQDFIVKCCVVEIRERDRETAVEHWNKRPSTTPVTIASTERLVHQFGVSDLCQICGTPKSMKDKWECKSPSPVAVKWPKIKEHHIDCHCYKLQSSCDCGADDVNAMLEACKKAVGDRKDVSVEEIAKIIYGWNKAINPKKEKQYLEWEDLQFGFREIYFNQAQSIVDYLKGDK